MRTIITYKGEVIASLVPGQKAILHCEDKDVKGDLVVVLTDEIELEALTAPTITLDGDILTITDESGLAEEFVILVDGVETATVGTDGVISFTITDNYDTTKTYQADSGMTFGQWVESEYNADGYGVTYVENHGQNVVYLGRYAISSPEGWADDTDEITSGRRYYLSVPAWDSGGSGN